MDLGKLQSALFNTFTSNISSNYTISSHPISSSGPWKIFDGKNKSTGKEVSVFVFDRRYLDGPSGNFGGRSGNSSLKRAQDEVVERLKKEASSLARLRHPSILELAEPVEESGRKVMFCTERVTASLSDLLREKDEQERSGGSSRTSRYAVQDIENGGRRKELEIDELEIQKGLLQVGKGLEFLHESAHLVHGNITPDAIFVNAKSDWKISGLGFSGSPDNATGHVAVPPIPLSEVLHHDPRLPRSVQLDLDYTSPDFVLDSNVTPASDLFSLGLLIVALYNSPHKSPIVTNSNPATYRKLFDSSSSAPSQANNFLASKPLSNDLSVLVSHLLTRRPAQRLDARELQQSNYFDNILVSTIRFLESLPAKTPNEKSQFLRGLPRILNQFPESVLERKLLPALLDELKDRELLSLILQDIFKIVKMLPGGQRILSDKIVPALRELFLTRTGHASDRDPAKEAGLMVLLENMDVITQKLSGKQFQDDILPTVYLSIQSTTHAIVDAGLKCLPTILPIMDFSTIKNELFPVVGAVFAKTSSLNIKVRSLEAFVLLCGGTIENEGPQSIEDELNGTKPKPNSGSALDKFTVQERVVPLLKSIKTKEPAVMMAAFKVFQEVSKIADSDFLAIDVLPILWAFALGPLLNLQQFQEYMNLIKSLSSKIEKEHAKKLEELSSNSTGELRNSRVVSSTSADTIDGGIAAKEEGDFERLVLGNKSKVQTPTENPWGSDVKKASPTLPSDINTRPQMSYGWSSSSVQSAVPASVSSGFRSITPDQTFNSFPTLTPTARPSSSSTTTSNAGIGMGVLQPKPAQSMSQWSPQPNPWSGSMQSTSNSLSKLGTGMSNMTLNTNRSGTNSGLSYSTSPAPLSTRNLNSSPSPFSRFNIAPPPGPALPSPLSQPRYGTGLSGSSVGEYSGLQKQQKTGIDAYESLI